MTTYILHNFAVAEIQLSLLLCKTLTNTYLHQAKWDAVISFVTLKKGGVLTAFYVYSCI